MERDGLRFRSGRMCLDLTATVVGRYRADKTDQLADSDDLIRWLRAVGLPHPRGRVTDDTVAQARELREAVYRLVHPTLRHTVDPEDVAVVNTWAALPDVAPQLAGDARSSYQLAARRPVEAALSALARDAVLLLAGGILAGVRECARADCSVMFLDTSRPGQRRWCDMAACGNQAKARRHRAQLR